jgi:trk system potassium uptake protein
MAFVPSDVLRDRATGHRYAVVQRVLGLLLMVFSLTLVPPLVMSGYLADGMARAFGTALWITLASGLLVWWPVRRAHADLSLRNGVLVVVLLYAVLSAFGAIPLRLSGIGWFTYVDALYETVAGLTTTGSTVISAGLDFMPPSLLYYRAQLQWVGGLGVIVLAVALLPILGVGGMQLYKAETPGPMKDAKLTPRIAGTARALWLIYVGLTVACGVTYWLLGMSVFDAVCHAMTTIATGGFSTHDASIGYFQNPTLEWAVMVFILLATFNFAVHFTAWRERNPLAYLRDAEIRACVLTLAGFVVAISLPLLIAGTYDSAGETVRKVAFQVVSYGSTTGFGTADPSRWPMYAPLMLMVCAFMSGCAGSTASGVKVVRIMLFVKQALREMYHLLHPSAEAPIKLQGRVVPDPIVYAIGGFFSVYIGFTIVLSFVMMTTGLDPITAFSSVAASINNLGPGLNHLAGSMADVTDFGKCVLMFTMLLGRLEIFTLLIIFTPGFWRR